MNKMVLHWQIPQNSPYAIVAGGRVRGDYKQNPNGTHCSGRAQLTHHQTYSFKKQQITYKHSHPF